VSENDDCHCTGTAKVVVKVMGRGKGDLGKQTILIKVIIL